MKDTPQDPCRGPENWEEDRVELEIQVLCP